MSCVEHLDDLVKEYLLFRRFNLTLKSFETEIKSEKEKGYRVEKFLDLLTHFISVHDLLALRDLWSHLNTRLFSRLEAGQLTAVNKLENSVLKLYLVNCIQTKHNDKVNRDENSQPASHALTSLLVSRFASSSSTSRLTCTVTRSGRTGSPCPSCPIQSPTPPSPSISAGSGKTPSCSRSSTSSPSSSPQSWARPEAA